MTALTLRTGSPGLVVLAIYFYFDKKARGSSGFETTIWTVTGVPKHSGGSVVVASPLDVGVGVVTAEVSANCTEVELALLEGIEVRSLIPNVLRLDAVERPRRIQISSVGV